MSKYEAIAHTVIVFLGGKLPVSWGESMIRFPSIL